MMLIALFARFTGMVMHLNWSESAITGACDLNHTAPKTGCCKLNNC